MSSYYPSFNYMGKNSLKDKHLMVVHFESGDSGEMETFLSMQGVYTESAYGIRRLDYGARYDSVALIRITVMKASAQDFTLAEVREFLKWTTGARKASYLDLVDHIESKDIIQASFFGHVINVLQHKLDARTVGFTIEFEATSPWAYSPIQHVSGALNQGVVVDENGVLCNTDSSVTFPIDGNLVVYSSIDANGKFRILDDGTVANSMASTITINNLTDDLYSYVYLNVVFKNGNGDDFSIRNKTLNESTVVSGLVVNEVVELSSEQFIISDVPNKTFGNTFNFVWPRLVPGVNEFIIDCAGTGYVDMYYRYPIKIGDCAVDVTVSTTDWCCGDSTGSSNNTGTNLITSWKDIIDKPTTIEGYGITNAYNSATVDSKLQSTATVDEQALDNLLASILNK